MFWGGFLPLLFKQFRAGLKLQLFHLTVYVSNYSAVPLLPFHTFFSTVSDPAVCMLFFKFRYCIFNGCVCAQLYVYTRCVCKNYQRCVGIRCFRTVVVVNDHGVLGMQPQSSTPAVRALDTRSPLQPHCCSMFYNCIFILSLTLVTF